MVLPPEPKCASGEPNESSERSSSLRIGPVGRLPAHVIDRAADGVEPGHQRRRTFEELDLAEIGGRHPARGDVGGAGRNAVVEHIDLGAGKSPHRKIRRRARGIAGQHADRALRGVGGGAVALLLHGLPGDDVDGRRSFDDRQPQPACARGDGVERRHGNPRQRLTVRLSLPGRRRRGGRRQLTGGLFGSRLRLLARRFDVDRRQRALILRDLRRGGAVCARPGPAAKSATAADVEMRRQRNAGTRSRMRPLLMTGNTPRPNGETVTRHPRFWLLRALPFAPGSNRVTAGLLRLRQDTPPNAFARDSLLVADVLARGSLPSATFPGFEDPSGHAGRRLAAHSCGGSRGMTCPQHAYRVPF